MVRASCSAIAAAALLCVGLSLLPGCAFESDAGADLVLVNGRVYTFSWGEPAADGSIAGDAPHDSSGWRPDAEAVAVQGGRIVFVGSSADAETFIGEATRVIDVDGATVVPGFVDSHTHIVELGRMESRVNLLGVETEEEAVGRVVEAGAGVPQGEWIEGWGWDEGEWANRYPTADLLSERFPHNPVVLRSLHGFAVWGNRAALAAAGIDRDTPEPEGGRILRNAAGSPSGVLIDRATTLLTGAIPEATDAQVKAHVLAGLETMAADGYVAIHEAGADSRIMAAFEELEAEGRLPIRVYAMLSLRDEALCRRWIESGPSTVGSMLTVRSVKAYYDAALGSRGARLLEDYSDRPGHLGVSGSSYGFDYELAAEMMRAGFQIGVHAIGDAGNRETLEFIESVVADNPETKALRHRIEHAQVVHPDDFVRFASSGIIAAMQPPHCVEDMSWAEDRLGPVRVKGAYAWRTLRRAGVHLTFSADLAGSDHDIFYGLHSAVTRRDKELHPPGGWYPEEAMTAEEAVRGYTNWSAHAAGWEDRTGKLQPGMWADLTVVDIDPLAVGETDPGRLLNGRILATVVGGTVVHDELSTRAEAEATSFLGEPLYPPAASAEMVDKQRKAEEEWQFAPEDLDLTIWYGRRTAYLGRYKEAIAIYTDGLFTFPDEPRLYRHRGHRCISTRQLDRAVDDLERAATLIEGTEDRVEQDGLPNARNIPVSTLHTNVWYHLALAYYLENDLANAERGWRRCLDASDNEDMVVAATHWLYMTLHRAGRAEDAAQALDPIHADMEIIENSAYHRLCLFYKGEIAEEELTGDEHGEVMNAAVAYGVGNWHLAEGHSERAREVFTELVGRDQWAAFGHIAAEADLARGEYGLASR